MNRAYSIGQITTLSKLSHGSLGERWISPRRSPERRFRFNLPSVSPKHIAEIERWRCIGGIAGGNILPTMLYLNGPTRARRSLKFCEMQIHLSAC